MDVTKDIISHKVLDNSHCVLVEFVNEANKIQTGFQQWLVDSPLNKKDIQLLINAGKVIIINWPDVDVAEASAMKGRLRKAKFEKTPVKIIAQGDWLKMREQQLNLEKFGKGEMSKKERKLFKKKVPVDDSLEEETPPPKKSRKEKLNTYSSDCLIYNKIQSKNPSISVNVSSPSNSSKSLTYDSENEEYSDEKIQDSVRDDPIMENSKVEILELKLREKEEDAECFKTELNDLKNKYKNLEKTLSVREETINYLKDQLRKQKSLLRDTIEDVFQIDERSQKILKNLKKVEDLALPLSDSTFSKLIHSTPAGNKSGDKSIDEIIASEERGSRDVDCGLSVDSEHDNSQTIDESKTPVKEETGEGFIISKKIINSCQKNSVSSYTNELLKKVFSEKELATSSASGRQCNANKNKNFIVKPALNAEKLRVIKAHVYKKFHRTTDTRKLVNAAVRNKLQEAARRLKEHGIIDVNEQD